MIYCDTSFLVPLYRPDDNWHLKATSYHDRHLQRQPFIFNPWQRWELRHNLRQLLRNARNAEKVFRRIEEDIAGGKLRHVNFGWTNIFDRRVL